MWQEGVVEVGPAAATVIFPSPPRAWESLVASAFVYRSKLPWLPLNSEFEQMSFEFFILFLFFQ